MIVEAHGHGIHWMEPKDLSFDEAVEALSSVDPLVTSKGDQPDDTLFYYRSGSLGRSVAYADCHVDFMLFKIRRRDAAALLTPAGGEPLEIEEIEMVADYPIYMRLNWSRVCTLSVFIIFALLPAPWAWRARRQIATVDSGDT